MVFLFEGSGIEELVRDLVNDPTRSPAFSVWGPLLEGTPALAREEFYWEAGERARRLDETPQCEHERNAEDQRHGVLDDDLALDELERAEGDEQEDDAVERDADRVRRHHAHRVVHAVAQPGAE